MAIAIIDFGISRRNAKLKTYSPADGIISNTEYSFRGGAASNEGFEMVIEERRIVDSNEAVNEVLRASGCSQIVELGGADRGGLWAARPERVGKNDDDSCPAWAAEADVRRRRMSLNSTAGGRASTSAGWFPIFPASYGCTDR